MDSDGVPVDLDYTKVGVINPRRSLAFVNNYITTCNHFLNRHLAYCDTQLAEVDAAESQLASLVSALDFKLSSVAALDIEADTTQISTTTIESTSTKENGSSIPQQPEVQIESQPVVEEIAQPEEDTSNKIEASKHPTYKRFFDMKKYGVVNPQIENAMRIQGIDPSLIDLDNPSQLIDLSSASKKPGVANSSSNEDSDSSDSSGSFSE